MVLFAVPTEGTGRLGVTATRKIGTAVVRTRAKRRLRELYRHRLESAVTESVDLVANARSSCADVSWTDLVADFDTCLRKMAERLETRTR